MSLAQKTAYDVYQRYNIGTLDPDVQKQLIILILNDGNATAFDMDEHQYTPLEQEYRDRARVALQEIEDGKARPIEEFFAEAESKYPWLCK